MTNPFDTFAIAARGHFKNAAGVEIVVYPDGSTSRTVTAVISYGSGASSNIPAAPRGTSQRITITVDNDGTTGLSADEFDPVKATALLPKKQGATPAVGKIVGILHQDAGRVTYEVR